MESSDNTVEEISALYFCPFCVHWNPRRQFSSVAELENHLQEERHVDLAVEFQLHSYRSLNYCSYCGKWELIRNILFIQQ